MPINLQGSGPIGEGWPGPPQLHAPEIGSLVAAILRNKLERDKMTQESIADTIKNVREERQSGAYLDAMKAAGLVPEDYEAGGAGGARYGTALAAIIERKRREDALEAHRKVMETRIGRGRGGGGGGGGGSAEPQTVWKDGIEWRPGPGGRWIPMKPAAGTKADVPKLSPTEKGWAAPEIPGLTVDPQGTADPLMPDIMSKDTLDASVAAGAPPLLKRPLESAGSTPSDKAGGHAQDYGVKAVYMKAPDGTVSTVDPNLVEYYKSKGAVIVPGP